MRCDLVSWVDSSSQIMYDTFDRYMVDENSHRSDLEFETLAVASACRRFIQNWSNKNHDQDDDHRCGFVWGTLSVNQNISFEKWIYSNPQKGRRVFPGCYRWCFPIFSSDNPAIGQSVNQEDLDSDIQPVQWDAGLVEIVLDLMYVGKGTFHLVD